MIAADDLIRLFRQALDEHWGYIWDMRGQVWTQKMQDNATRDATVRYGSKWVGRRVADCSGLFVWAYGVLGEKIFHGSNTIFNKHTSATGMLYGEVEILPGTAVFQVNEGRRTHIGLYVGAGKCIEAHGTRSGVIESNLSDWDEWGTLAAVDYSDVEPDHVTLDSLKTLRKGDSGLTVKWLQELLLAAGHDLGKADGVYGSKTKAAVEDFQRANGLTVDGIAGKKTIAALRKTDDDIEPEAPEDDEPEVTPLTMEQKVNTMWEWWLTVAGGGESDG